MFRDLGNHLDPIMQNASKEQFEAFDRGFLTGMGIGAGALLLGADLYYTGGKVTSYFFGFLAVNTASQLHYYDKLSPEEQLKVRKDVKNDLVMELTGLGVAKILVGTYKTGRLGISIGDEAIELIDDLPEVVVTTRKSRASDVIFTESGAGRTWAKVDGEDVGRFDWNPKERSVEVEINLSEKLKGQGIGSRIFAEAVDGVDIFKAKWVRNDDIYENGISDNLVSYEVGKAAKLSDEQAAWQTWSGQQAKKHGYNKVEVSKIENGIQAKFTKE